MKQIMIFLTVCFCIVGFSPHAYAETHMVKASATYTMGDGESKSQSEQNALLQAERNASEQMGVYIESYSKTVNFELKEDEIISIASNILKLDKKEFKWEILNGTFVVTCDIVAEIDDVSIDEFLKHNVKYQKTKIENKQLKNEKEIQTKQIRHLEEKVGTLQNHQEYMNQLPNPIADKALEDAFKNSTSVEETIRKLKLATQIDTSYTIPWLFLGFEQYHAKMYDDALESLAIAKTQNWTKANALWGEGMVYKDRGLYDEALERLLTSVKLGSSQESIYSDIGECYWNLNNKEMADVYFRNAIYFYPNSALVYCKLADYYSWQNLNSASIKNYKKSISIDPKWKESYLGLADVYYKQKDYANAYVNYVAYYNMSKNNIYFTPQEQEEILKKINKLQSM